MRALIVPTECDQTPTDAIRYPPHRCRLISAIWRKFTANLAWYDTRNDDRIEKQAAAEADDLYILGSHIL
jgi:hypothetical protein